MSRKKQTTATDQRSETDANKNSAANVDYDDADLSNPKSEKNKKGTGKTGLKKRAHASDVVAEKNKEEALQNESEKQANKKLLAKGTRSKSKKKSSRDEPDSDDDVDPIKAALQDEGDKQASKTSLAKNTKSKSKKKSSRDETESDDDIDPIKAALQNEGDKKASKSSLAKNTKSKSKKKPSRDEPESDDDIDPIKVALQDEGDKQASKTSLAKGTKSKSKKKSSRNESEFDDDIDLIKEVLREEQEYQESKSSLNKNFVSTKKHSSESIKSKKEELDTPLVSDAKNIKTVVDGSMKSSHRSLDNPDLSHVSSDYNYSPIGKKEEDNVVIKYADKIVDKKPSIPKNSILPPHLSEMQQSTYSSLDLVLRKPSKLSKGQILEQESRNAVLSKSASQDNSEDPESLGIDDPSSSKPGKVRKKSKVLEKRIKKSASTAKKAASKRLEAGQEPEEDVIEGPDDDEKLRGLSTTSLFGFASGHTLGEFGANPIESISVTGILTTPPGKMDVQIKSLTLQAHGKHLINDTELNLNTGRRYGLIAPNGSGKSTLLTTLACGLFPLPKALTVYLLDREFKESEMTATEAVIDIVTNEQAYLTQEEEKYAVYQDKYPEIFNYIQNRIQELENRNSETEVRNILIGLGFTEELMKRKTKNLSGGWRMRLSLARILFSKPLLMLLDEPTNHLDLESVVWLEDYLVNETEGCTVLLTSHSQDTLNEVCTDIIQIYNKTLHYYNGRYDTFCKLRTEREALIRKKAEALKKKMSRIKESLGTSGVRHVQAMQRAKNIKKAAEKKCIEDNTKDFELEYVKELVLRFEKCGGGIPSPALKVVDMSFGYKPNELLFENLNFGVDLKSRIALVGVNGSGKSTLMKLMLSKLTPTSGYVQKHHNVRCAMFSQNMAEQLDYEMSPVKWLCSIFKEYRDQDMRRILGRYGLTGKSHVIKIKNLSDGQRRRVLFAYIGLRNPHILFMDEPTNALDIETIDHLAEAINEFDGGVVMISHDFRLLDQVVDTVWIVKDKKVTVYPGEIKDYKANVKKQCELRRLERMEEIAKKKK